MKLFPTKKSLNIFPGKDNDMRCVSVTEYVCDVCGYITDSLPYCFPKCPACSPCENKVYNQNNKENKVGKNILR